MSGTPYRVGIYPGTFDPTTFGHLDIFGRARKLVDKLVIGVASNPGKNPLFTEKERVAMVEELIGPEALASGEVEVKAFDNLLVHFAQSVDATIIVRGLRAVSDFEYEFQMAGMNDCLDDNIETVFLMAEAGRQPISSSLVKEIARLGGDVSQFVPPLVEKQLVAKWKARNAGVKG